MSKFIPEFVGGLEIAAGAVLLATGVGAPLAWPLIAAGAGTLISGIGTLLSKGPVNGFATTMRNPVAPREVVYGRVRTGGTLVYFNQWGDSDKMWDLVIAIATHPCESIDAVLFDQQRVQIDTTARPAGSHPSSGTSFTPVQQRVTIAHIQRTNGVVTVTLLANIPYLIEGDHLQITDVPGDLTLNGTFQVAQILSQVFGSPGSIVFTYLSGGPNSDVTAAGHVTTLWADYGRKVYFEPLLGGQTLGQTFAGMIYPGTPADGDMGNFVNPDNQGGLGGGTPSIPNPWTSDCSLQGMTAVFIRIHYNDQYFKGGLPQISFLAHGKNDIEDPRTSPPTVGYSENAALCIADYLKNQTWGFKAAWGTEIPLPDLIAAANTCDEQVPLALSTASPPITEPAYALNGKFSLTTKRGEVLQNMLTACAGRITYTGGQFKIFPAAWIGIQFAIGSNPGGGIVPLGDFEALAAGPVQWRPTTAIRDLFNGAKGTYISKANKWMSTDIPPYAQDADHGYSVSPAVPEMDANLAADGGDRRWFDTQLPFTISAAAAQRILKIELLRRRFGGTGTLVLNMGAYPIAPLDLIEVTWAPFGWSAKQFEVQATRLRIEEGHGDGEGPVLLLEVDIKETDASIFDWHTVEELSPQGYKQPQFANFDFFVSEKVPGFTEPYPWEPGYVAPLVGDALYPGPVVGSPRTNEGRASFGMQVMYGIDAGGYPVANLAIKGTAPPSRLSPIAPPQITCVAGTSGRLPPGTYVVAASALDLSSPVRNSALSVPVPVTIPVTSPPANNGSIEVTVAWPPDSNGGEIYVAGGSTAAGYHYQGALTSAETAFTLTDFDQASPGAPDATFDHLAVAWKKVIHGGVWAEQVQAVTPNSITIGGEDMTLNQWAGYVLSLLGKLDSTQELIILNMPVESSTASTGASPGPAEFTLTIGPNANGDQLPDLTTLLVPGDLVVMRFKATFGSQSFQDPNIANPYYPAGATGIEAGHLALMLAGPDAGDVQTIGSVSTDGDGNKTIVELAGPWAKQPNDGDIVIVVEPAWGPGALTQPIPSPNRTAASGELAAPVVTNLAAQTWLFIVYAQNTADDNGADAYAPMREIYIFGSQGTRTIATSQTMLPTDRIIDVDASAGPVVYTLLPFSQIPNQGFYIQKIDASSNSVTILCAGSPPIDTINGESSIVLENEWDRIAFFVSGA